MKPVKLIIIGAGSRGSIYAEFADQYPKKAQIVGVAEPRQFYRDHIAKTHKIPVDKVFDDWQKVTQKPKFADAVIIATQDNMHLEPAIAFANLGYHILLEKPIAPTPEECHLVVDAALKNKVLFSVCHVLRYTAYTQILKEIVDSGEIGEIVNMQHLEPVGYFHHAHSFVRGNWRNESGSSFMLLSKSCHDIDWISYILGERCLQVSSFGGLYHFRKENKPSDSADRCLDCNYEPQCPYSAKKIYLGRVEQGDTGWPVDIVTTDPTVNGLTQALRTGPYGRCVYNCDNDVVDHQVVNLLFEGGKTVTFTMTAFNEMGPRKTRIFGTRGEIYGDGENIEVFDFLTDRKRTISTGLSDGSILSGHGGGDYSLMKNFVEAVASGKQSNILSGPIESLESYLMVFAAEDARKRGTVEQLVDYWNKP